MGSMEGKVVVVTGASRGLGAAIARAFSLAGAHVVMGSRNQAALDALAHELPSALPVQCDVTEVSDLQGLADAAIGTYGRLDVWVNNAGVAVYSPLLETREADFDQMMAVNVKGVYFGSQVALAEMKKEHQGLIVNISSVAGVRHLPNESAYSATKWAVQGITGILRKEAAQYGVKVTSIVAGGIDTPFWKEMDYLPFPPEIEPERDFMKPREVAQVVLDVAVKSDHFLQPEVMCEPMIR